MPQEIQSLTDNPILLVAILFIGAFTALLLNELLAKQRRTKWRNRNRWRSGNQDRVARGPWQTKGGLQSDKITDAADQLRTVMDAEFTVQPLLNKSEARLFRELDKLVIAKNPAWQVMAQVSLGEILRCKDYRAYSCINSKRVDLLLVDGDCAARHAIEYQGDGHHQKKNSAAARDAVKKEALRKAGIGYHEVVAGHTKPADLRALVEKLVPEKME
jgi:hypothetical protein